MARRGKKLRKRLATRQRDYDETVGKKDTKAYRRPGGLK